MERPLKWGTERLEAECTGGWRLSSLAPWTTSPADSWTSRACHGIQDAEHLSKDVLKGNLVEWAPPDTSAKTY